MKILLILYGLCVFTSLICGVLLWWYTSDEGTNSEDYKLAKILMKYAIIFPYGIIKIIDLLEQEQKDGH